MNKQLLLIFILLNFISIASAEEDSLSFATYYPAPYGNYREMRAMRMAIGDNYVKTNEYDWETGATHLINSDADLIVEGNVGIGTANPAVKLDVEGTAQIQGNLTVTNDILVGTPTASIITTIDCSSGNGLSCTKTGNTVTISYTPPPPAPELIHGTCPNISGDSDAFCACGGVCTGGSSTCNGQMQNGGTCTVNCGAPRSWSYSVDCSTDHY